jgi:hypothetical protein
MIIFDFEVYPKDWVVVLADASTHSFTITINDREHLEAFYSQHKSDIWVGYNCREYDQFILKGILLQMNAFDLSHAIINEQKKGWQISSAFNQVPLILFDVMTDKFKGLKQLEGFMGHSIEETDVPFNENRKLTATEIGKVVNYCRHDVEQTIEVFLNRKEEFDSHLSLIKAFNMPISFLAKTKSQLAAIILGAQRRDHQDEFAITIPDNLQLEKYASIRDWYLDPMNCDYSRWLTAWVSGVKHVFAWGGLHGARECYRAEGTILAIDVASYYPALMIEYGFCSRNIRDPQKYREIRDRRMQLKAAKDPMQQPYKIVLNATYGSMKDRYNALYDPLMANNVCVNGQLLLLDLIEKLEPHWDLIQSNTDGLVGLVTSDMAVVTGICHEWEERTRMVLEYEVFSKIIQKDVNNYILVRPDGTYKSKGAYVKELDVLDNDLAIVNRAVVANLVHDLLVEETIRSSRCLMEFQKVVKLSGKYTHFQHGDKPLREKTLRIFASRDLSDPGVFKVKSEGRIEKVAGSPSHIFIDNGYVRDKPLPAKLDLDWYIREAKSRIADFIGDSELIDLLCE